MNMPAFPSIFQRSLVIHEIMMLSPYKKSGLNRTDITAGLYIQRVRSEFLMIFNNSQLVTFTLKVTWQTAVLLKLQSNFYCCNTF